MTNIFLTSIILMMGTMAQTQSVTKGIPISIGYFSFLGYQPGAKVSTHFDLKSWEASGKQFSKGKSLFLRPAIGFYTRPNIHTSYLFNADFGYKIRNQEKQKYAAWSIGLGYLHQAQVVSQQVNLSDGSKEKIRENWAWFLPTLNYEFGKAINDKIGWYSRLSYGLKMAKNRDRTGLLFIELGFNLNLWVKE